MPVIMQVKSIREHYWTPYIKKLFEEKILHGDQTTLCGILDKEHHCGTSVFNSKKQCYGFGSVYIDPFYFIENLHKKLANIH